MCLQLFKSLCGQWVTSPQEVIRLLQYKSVDGNFMPTSNVVITEDDKNTVKTLFARYLKGSGHPQHIQFGPDLISPEVHERDKDDKLIRSCQLLAMVTGSELLPSNPLQRITVYTSVRFTFIIADQYQVQFIHQLPDMHLHGLTSLAPGSTVNKSFNFFNFQY